LAIDLFACLYYNTHVGEKSSLSGKAGIFPEKNKQNRDILREGRNS